MKGIFVTLILGWVHSFSLLVRKYGVQVVHVISFFLFNTHGTFKNSFKYTCSSTCYVRETMTNKTIINKSGALNIKIFSNKTFNLNDGEMRGTKPLLRDS